MSTQLRCPSCGSVLERNSENEGFVECRCCKKDFCLFEGVLCLVPDNLFTLLDSIDYDEHYSVSNKSSQQAFLSLKNVLGSRLKDNYEVLIEIGAGTGGFTKGLLTNIKVKNAIITDISSKMLSICRKRVLEGNHLADDVIFATYSTEENIFPLNSIDCIIGSFVLHHILNYKGFVERSYGLLKSGGSFIFAEPSFKFHYALALSMFDVLETLLSEGDANLEGDLIKFGNWIHELNFNLKYAGDEDVLRGREDKHLFIREEVERSAYDIGFDLVETIPYGNPEAINQCLLSYLPQLDLSSAFLGKITNLFDFYHAKYFCLLENKDRVPSYVFFFKK